MPLKSDLKELLSGFEKRMKFINIVRCILDYTYPENIRQMIPDRKILDNITLSVLVYIKDRTLGSERICTLKDVESFLDDLSVILPDNLNIDSKELARYIIVDILQNSGVLTEYLTYDSESEKFKMMPIRLLNEEKGTYHLTDDAFDFLFRSKEIETELDYSITRFRMMEYMKRENYEKALEESRELVSRIRSMKLNIDDFILRCRENISKITIDQYESVVTRIRSLLESEYDKLDKINNLTDKKAKELEDAQRNGISNDDIRKKAAALFEIKSNITLAIDEQRKLINQKSNLSKSYEILLKDYFKMSHFERMNFKKDIMNPLQHMNDKLGDACSFLLFMLTKPELDKKFSIENFYAPQARISDELEEEGFDITSEETDYELDAQKRNERNRKLIERLFVFFASTDETSISSFIKTLSIGDLIGFCEENTLPNILLSLFAMQELNIEEWKNSENFTLIPNGEFELSWCLQEIPQNLLDMKKIIFEKLNKTFSFQTDVDNIKHQIDMTDFKIQVIR